MSFDKPLLIALIGMIAAIPFEIYTRILLSLGIGKYSTYQLSSLIVTIDRPNAILGMVITSLVASVIAVLFYYSLKITGFDFIKIKSIIAGLFGWIFCELFYTWLIEGQKFIAKRPVSDYYLEMTGACIFGLTIGLLFQIFESTSKKAKIK